MIGNEIVESKESKAPSKAHSSATPENNVRERIANAHMRTLRERLRFMAPLIISQNLTQKGLGVYERAVKSI